MNNLVKIASLCFVALLLTASPLLAQEGDDPGGGDAVAAAPASNAPLIPTSVGIGLIVIGGGLGIGKLASSALESMARQPEMAGQIQTAMIIAAALIEGFTFFAIIMS